MDRLQIALESKTLEELLPIDTEVVTTQIEPTEEEILKMVELLRNGHTFNDVKTQVRRVTLRNGVQTSAKGFSHDQVKEVYDAWKLKIQELSK